MGLLDRLRRTHPSHPRGDTREAAAPSDAHLTGRSVGISAGSELDEGVAVRVALERGDVDEAVRAAVRFRAARATAQGRVPEPAFDSVPRESVALPLELGCYEELGLSAAGVAEARLALALANAAWTDAASGLAAVYLALGPQGPLRWQRFARERTQFSTGEPPYLWQRHRAVLAGDPPALPEKVADLSRDARDVLAHSKLIRRRQVVDRGRLRERTYLPPDRLDQALAELEAAGFAGTPSWGDRLAELTVEQLKTGHTRAGLPGTGTKPRLVQALLDQVPEEQLGEILTAADPALLEADLVVGLGLGKQADWLLHFCELAAHWLQFQQYRERDRRALLQAGSVLRGYQIDRHDDCATCAAGPTQITAATADMLPPFHIGCRCAPLPQV